MNEISPPGYGTYLRFASPLAQTRADQIVKRVAATEPETILDIGCGWGELMLQLAAACPAATAIGVDTNRPDIERGRRNALERGLSDRVTLVHGPGAEQRTPADVVLCIGSSHAFGDIPTALEELKNLVNPGGRLVYADCFWERPPTATDLGRLWPDASADEHTDLNGLVTQTVDAGYQPLWIETVNREEWEHLESGHLADDAHWLLEHGDSDAAADIRRRHVNHRRQWLEGTRDLLGFAYLTLGTID